MTNEAHPYHVKVGSSKNPRKRLREFNISDPGRQYSFYDLRFFNPGYFEAEQIMHLILDEYRLGGEWFNVPPESAQALLNRLHIRKE